MARSVISALSTPRDLSQRLHLIKPPATQLYLEPHLPSLEDLFLSSYSITV